MKLLAEPGVFHAGCFISGGGAGRLPPGFYALAEQFAGGLGPKVLTPEGPVVDEEDGEPSGSGGMQSAVAIAERPSRVQLHAKAEVHQYARKAIALAIRHSSNHKVVAIIEIVSPGNEGTRHALSKFVAKAVQFLEAGVHLLIIDLIRPAPSTSAAVSSRRTHNPPLSPRC